MRCCPGRADFGRFGVTVDTPWLPLALGLHPVPTVRSLPALVLVSWLAPALGWPPAAWPGEAADKKRQTGSARKGPQLPHWHRARWASQEEASTTAEPGATQPSQAPAQREKPREFCPACVRSFLNPLSAEACATLLEWLNWVSIFTTSQLIGSSN